MDFYDEYKAQEDRLNTLFKQTQLERGVLKPKDGAKVHPLSWIYYKEHIFEEGAVVVSIDDEAAGLFVRIRQNSDQCNEGVALDPTEVETVLSMVKQAAQTIEEFDNDL